MKTNVLIDNGNLTLDDFIAVSRRDAIEKISKKAVIRINNSRQTVNEFVDSKS